MSALWALDIPRHWLAQECVSLIDFGNRWLANSSFGPAKFGLSGRPLLTRVNRLVSISGVNSAGIG